MANSYPKLHNATWPGVVGKGSGDGEPCVDLKTMLDLTKGASVNGVGFDGFDLFLAPPHFDLARRDEEIDAIAKYCDEYKFEVGSFVANVWAGSAIGSEEKRATFLAAVDEGCAIGAKLRELGVRPSGCVRIDSSCSVDEWLKAPEENQKQIVETFKAACAIAEKYGETLAMEGEVCWGGMHSWRRNLQILESVDKPGVLGLQADMSHTLLFLLGVNAPEDRLVPADFDWADVATFDAAYKKMTDALRPWTVDFHVAQNDGTVFGSGSHDKTGRHCLPNDPNGKLDIAKYAKFWLAEDGVPTKKIKHLCWDGCMFPNAKMLAQETWNEVLAAMISVREACGWN